MNSSVSAQHLGHQAKVFHKEEKNTVSRRKHQTRRQLGRRRKGLLSPSAHSHLLLTFLTLKSYSSRAPFSSYCARSSFKPIHARDTRQAWHARETKQARGPFLTCIGKLGDGKGKLVLLVHCTPTWLVGEGSMGLANHPPLGGKTSWHKHITATSLTGLQLMVLSTCAFSVHLQEPGPASTGDQNPINFQATCSYMALLLPPSNNSEFSK